MPIYGSELLMAEQATPNRVLGCSRLNLFQSRFKPSPYIDSLRLLLARSKDCVDLSTFINDEVFSVTSIEEETRLLGANHCC